MIKHGHVKRTVFNVSDVEKLTVNLTSHIQLQLNFMLN